MNQDEAWLLKEKWYGEKSEGFFTDCARLKDGEPLAYVIGHVPFLDTIIYLDSHPLIPRPETEYWVEKIIKVIENNRNNKGRTFIKVLDLCAGSGCIGVAVLKSLPMSRVDFVEIDTGHRPTIEKNIVSNDIDRSRARIFGGDLFEHIIDTYDYIFTNPPYIDPVLARTEVSVLAHEPHEALFGGKDGLFYIRKIIHDAPRFLIESGTLVIEHEPEQSEAIHSEAAEVGRSTEQAGFSAITHKDQFGVERYTYLTPH